MLFSIQDVLVVLNPLWLTRNPTDCNGDSLGYARQRWMIRSKVASKGGGHGSRVMIDTEVQKYRVILMVNDAGLQRRILQGAVCHEETQSAHNPNMADLAHHW